MKKLLVISVLLFSPSSFSADQKIIECSACNYRTQVMEGQSKMEAIKIGSASSPFFCSITKEFVTLKTVYDEALYAKASSGYKGETIATPTTKRVKSSDYVYFSAPLCKNSLVPLAYYKKSKKLPCPVCGKGELKITNGFTAD